jgi:TonB family protein
MCPPSSCDQWYPRNPDGTEHAGVVDVNVCVASNSTVASVTLAHSSGHDDLDGAAVAMMKAGHYKAGTVDGQPVARCKIMRVTFTPGHKTVTQPQPQSAREP